MSANHKGIIARLAITVMILVLGLATGQALAAPRGQSATSLGVTLNTAGDQMVVVATTSNLLGLQVGDRIVAVNGRRVSTEAAFVNRLKIASGNQSPTIIVARNNQLQTLSVRARQSTGGWMNPDLMVLTSQGVMHVEAAERLGLPGTPIHGTEERSLNLRARRR